VDRIPRIGLWALVTTLKKKYIIVCHSYGKMNMIVIIHLKRLRNLMNTRDEKGRSQGYLVAGTLRLGLIITTDFKHMDSFPVSNQIGRLLCVYLICEVVGSYCSRGNKCETKYESVYQ